MRITRGEVESYLERFATVRVVVIGDIMLDRYFWGVVDRISPEAPVPVVRITRKNSRLGGAANVAANLRDLGVNVTLLGVTGSDHAADELETTLNQKSIEKRHVKKVKGRSTTEKIRIVAQNQQVVRADIEDDDAVPEWCADYFLEILQEEVGAADALLISDYGKGVIQEGFLRETIDVWKRKGKPVLVDPNIGHFLWYKGAFIVTPNAREARSFYGSSLDGSKDIENIGFKIREALDLEALLITRGEEGMSLFLRENLHIHVPTVAKEVYDVTGAGDTVISVLAAACGAGVGLENAVVIANRAAGEVVKEIGTSTLTRELLLAAFD